MISPAQRIRVCHLVHRFATGGLENGLVNLINHLPADRYEHVILTMQGHDPEFAKRLQVPVQILNAHKQEGKDLGVYLRVFRLIRQCQPDIVHTRNLATIEMSFIAMLAGVGYRIHGEHGWDVNDPNGSVVKYQKLRAFLGRFIHRFVALSRDQESYLLNRVGIPPRKVIHICNGVDLQRFSRIEKASQTVKDPAMPLVIGCVGRLAKIKGHDVLIRAFHKLLQKIGKEEASLAESSGLHEQAGSPQRGNPGTVDNNVVLRLVGDGEERSTLERLAEELGVAPQIEFLGNRSDIPSLMAEFDIFVLPSRAEGISNTILEAMASSLPVVVTDVGGNRELVACGETGLVVPAGNVDALQNSLSKLISDYEKRMEFGAMARQRVVDKFSLEKMINKYNYIYLYRD